MFLFNFNFIIIVKYIFTFHSKNPTAVQDDFWAVFLVIWATGKKCLKIKTKITASKYGISGNKPFKKD